ncbi:MAG: prepilin-type N-terminal cleavage/methylation domain-containing protein [Myxococcales bacterium]|nr:prepilin-type N-terminal cleavage/methylation domain-containing protein [Myxococcales bacterium]
MKRRKRGVTLVEVLVVVAIIALVAAGVAFGALPKWLEAQDKTATASARVVRRAVKSWWMVNDVSRCPTIDDLVQSGDVDRDGARTDPWGSGWRIECADSEVTVSSAGRDKQFGTGDDIRVPPT